MDPNPSTSGVEMDPNPNPSGAEMDVYLSNQPHRRWTFSGLSDFIFQLRDGDIGRHDELCFPAARLRESVRARRARQCESEESETV